MRHPNPQTPEQAQHSALLWLNDHCGEVVSVSLGIDQGDYSVTPLLAEGKLEHWRQSGTFAAAASLLDSREDLIGFYMVGGTALDLSDLPAGTTVRPSDPDGIVIDFDNGATMTIYVVAGNVITGSDPAG